MVEIEIFYMDGFMEHGMEKATNMKLILCFFDKLSSLRINFHKSEDLLLWQGHRSCYYKQHFRFGTGSFLSFWYLDIPNHHRKLMNKECKKKLVSWKGKLQFYWGVLFSSTSCVPMFILYSLCKQI